MMDMGMQETQFGPMMILGMPWFREYYTTFDLGDGSHLELASATVVINNGETIDIAEVPRGGLRDYTFHFTPLEK